MHARILIFLPDDDDENDFVENDNNNQNYKDNKNDHNIVFPNKNNHHIDKGFFLLLVLVLLYAHFKG